MKSEAVLLAREKLKSDMLNGFKDISIELMRSPIFQMLIFCITVEMAQKITFKDKPLLSDFLGNVLETTVVTSGVIETLAGTISSAINPLKDISGAIAPLIHGG